MKKENKQNLLLLLFPPRCPACDEVQAVEGFCTTCKKNITMMQEPVCKKCGKQLKHQQQEFCNDCTNRKHYFDQGKGVYLYEGDIKLAMYRLKYSNRRCYGRVFARQAAKKYKRWIFENKVEAIIPVPMYKKKQNKRGYNQAEILAKEIGRQIGVPVYTEYIARNRDTLPQKGLTDVERRNNLKKAFKIRQNRVQLNRILIIDDIYTTGSTIDALALTLREVGVKKIYHLCICVGKGY